MQNTAIAVGIDVAKATLSVCVKYQDGSERALSISNTEADITKVVRLLDNFNGKIVMESTGHYQWLAALLLSEAGHDVRVINPLLAKKYTQSNIRKIKTDKADAKVLATIALVEEHLPQSFAMNRDKLMLRKKLGLIASLHDQAQMTTATLHGYEEARKILKQPASSTEKMVERTIVRLKKQVKLLEQEFIRDTEPTLTPLVTIPGVSPFMAAIANHWFSHAEGRTKKSWISFAGLDVSSRESGTWFGQCHLTKRGNSFLRQRLFCSAWGAIMHDPDFRKYYDYLRKERGRSYVEALIIIARKIVCIMFEMTKTNSVFDPNRQLFVPAVGK